MTENVETGVRETQDIAAEIVMMIARRTTEGTDCAAIGAGISMALDLISKAALDGVVICEIVRENLKDIPCRAPPPRPDGGRA